MIKVSQVEMFEDRVLVKPFNADETVFGFIVPENAREKPQFGEVVNSGPGTPEKPNVTRQGDTVFYGKYAGLEIEIDGEKYLIMREADIAARINKATECKEM